MPTPNEGEAFTSGGVDDLTAEIRQDAVDLAAAEIDQTDLDLLAPKADPTFTGVATAPAFSVSGLTGSVAASRYVGATASGAPASGAHLKGDFVIDQTGKIWICTVAGTPGTWVSASGASGAAPPRVWTVIPPPIQTGASALSAANDAYGFMVEPLTGSVSVSKVYLRPNVSAGNVDVGIGTLSGTTLTFLATSGSTACPVAGEATVNLSGAITLDPAVHALTPYFIVLSCDNVASATFYTGTWSGNCANSTRLVTTMGFRKHTRGGLALGASLDLSTNTLAAEGTKGFILAAK